MAGGVREVMAGGGKVKHHEMKVDLEGGVLEEKVGEVDGGERLVVEGDGVPLVDTSPLQSVPHLYVQSSQFPIHTGIHSP